MLADGRGGGSRFFKLKMGGDVGWDLDCATAGRSPGTGLPVHGRCECRMAYRREAVEALPILAKLGFVLVEQPVGADWENWRELREYTRSAPALIADESFQDAEDLPEAAELADGVNVKILKAGG